MYPFIKPTIFFTVMLASVTSVSTADDGITDITDQSPLFLRGIDYKRVVPAQRTVNAKRVEIIKFFWYGCHDCLEFDSRYAQWVKHYKSSSVDLVNVPIVYNAPPADPQVVRRLAASYYVAVYFDIEQDISQAIYKAMHEASQTFSKDADVRKLFKQNGITVKDFDRVFYSAWVRDQVALAARLTQTYDPESVPALAINGKFITYGKATDTLLQIAEYLSKREQARIQMKY